MKATPDNVNSKDPPAFALEDALSSYGIRTNPFPIGEVDDFYFATPELARQHDVLRNLVEYGDLLLVVSGVEGAGKTAFLRSFLLAPGDRWRWCRIDAGEDMSRDALIDALLAGFGVNARSDAFTGDASTLQAHLSEIRANGDIALVAIDDAHLLPQEGLEYLLELAEKRAALELRLLFASEPAALGFSTADTKRVHTVVLKPFDAQQCADYVNTRLSRAGLVGDSPFDAEVVEGIHADSGGVPGSIHPLALHSLLANADTPHLRRRATLSLRSLAYAAALIVAVGAAVLMLTPEPAVDQATAPAAATSGRIQRLETTTDNAGRDQIGAPASEQPAVGSEVSALANRASIDEGSSIIETRAPRDAVAPGGAAKAIENSESARLGERSVPPDAAVSTASTAALDKRVTAAGGDEALIRLATNVTPKTTPDPAATEGVRGNDWLARQDPSHFVLQLVGTRDAAAARGFVERHGLAGNGTWIATSHDGKPWYVVVYGAYPDRATARAAIETLPSALRARTPWPRTVASLVTPNR